jgi:hypothetical protein
MKTKITRALSVMFLSTVFAASASAEVKLKDNSEIVGKWLLESVAMGINSPRIEEKRMWQFRADGTAVTSGYNRHLKQDDSREFKYEVTDGKIKAEDPGRPGKTVDYVVYDKTGDAMVLKGGIEGFYFFKKQ